MKNLLCFVLIITPLIANGQKIEGDYQRPYTCAGCVELLSLKNNKTYTRNVTFDWGTTYYNGAWNIVESKLLLDDKVVGEHSLSVSEYHQKEFCIAKNEENKSLTMHTSAYISKEKPNLYYLYSCQSNESSSVASIDLILNVSIVNRPMEVGYGAVYTCKINKIEKGFIKDSTIFITILAGDHEKDSIFSKHIMKQETLEISFVKYGESEKYSMIPINGFVDLNKKSWEIVYIKP